ncbi:SusC/RagA family TonB-linked outer membrane protein [Echinicola shivajiensis]|uniref:SusC/RagA family TonB-linked outer membrane protein n=1 Tax=Echinicola shivajiensis TaxID=1035916 RepID=UPI001FE3ED6B|nr:SusC/RagA family TonB-linked outer membrane protein [Echinicola shivajiensis]
MHQHLLIISLLWYMLTIPSLLHGQEIHSLEGRVTDSREGSPLPGALVSLGENGPRQVTDENGNFNFRLKTGTYTLSVHYLGYVPLEETVELNDHQNLSLQLEQDGLLMEGVEVLSTGYQEIPKERATGSFVQVDQELINRSVGVSVIDRLEDVTSGLAFNKVGNAADPISIRGRNTLFANTQPLIVVDNFPYNGPIENINPNNVESITVLRDAAAASIWGARAGNGVIVITTKRGTKGKPRLSFNANVNFTEEQDPFYRPTMSMADFIDIESMLFGQGFYSRNENASDQRSLPPAVETLIKLRDGLIDPTEADRQLDLFRSGDMRRDLLQHYYRPQMDQQYALNFSGGSDKHRYAVSAGYDHNLGNVHGNDRNRITLGLSSQWTLLQDRLHLDIGLNHTRMDARTTTELPDGYSPYERLTDEAGKSSPITADYSSRYLESDAVSGLLDWRYIPLEEKGEIDGSTVQDDFRANLGLAYTLLDGLKASVKYQYWQNRANTDNYRSPDLYFVRDLVNRFTQDTGDGELLRIVPNGGILDLGSSESYSHSFRSQLDFDRKFGNHHRIDALAGFELRDQELTAHSNRYYGYNPELMVSSPVDYTTRYPMYHSGSFSTVPYVGSHTGTIDRFVSYYFNAGYSFKRKLMLTVSARKDASNLFGVEANQRWIPLWSVGAGWTISEEPFYNGGYLSFLKLRGSFGYNGNVDKSVSALTAARYFSNYSFVIPAGELAATIINPPNPDLRWERIGILNLGLDLESHDGRIRASLEGYYKKGLDLIGDTPMRPSSGMTEFRGNSANMESKGIDLDLQTVNLNGPVSWHSNLLFSLVKEKVTDYFFKGAATQYLQGSAIPLEGRPLYAMYSLPYAGLDPATGAPLGYLDGEVSDDYSAIFGEATPDNIQYHGSRRPTVFGSLRNTISWKGFSLSANLSFKLGYYYRRQSVAYNDLLSGRIGHADYADRWQEPGDELSTQIPAMPENRNTLRDNLYTFSDFLVERGDHIRLRDVRLAYRFDEKGWAKLPFRSAQVYLYANNLGILWKAAKNDPLDPDYRITNPLKSIAVGVKMDF